MKFKTAEEIRQLIRSQEITDSTAGMAIGYTQANLVILRKEHAYDFLLFSQRNPKACPIIEVTDVGSPIPKLTAPNSDIRTDLPRYRIYRDGKFDDEVLDITPYWENDMVAFLIGCSFTFETALLENDIPVRHIEERCNVPMYITNIQCEDAGKFHGPMVVSMRPMTSENAIRATQITSRYPQVHGSPVHIGDPSSIGITNIHKPDFGDSVTIKKNEIPVFWACGVTPQAVAMESKPDLMITHGPGCMFITDLLDKKLSVI